MMVDQKSNINELPAGRGVKQGEDPSLFQKRTQDSNITPDRVSPTIMSYFRIPPVWIGSKPGFIQNGEYDLVECHETLIRRNLKCGIRVRVQRDGLFVFDFTNFQSASFTFIPGYIHPQGRYRVPKEHTDAQLNAENVAVVRAQIINAHQLCLNQAEIEVSGWHSAMGFPVAAWNTFKSIDIEEVPPYQEDSADLFAMARNFMSRPSKYFQIEYLGRREVSIDTVEHSLRLLDKILLMSPNIIAITEGAYIAACRAVEKRFGECLVLGWTVCEQLISVLWKSMIDNQKADNGDTRMSKKRAEKLDGRDYTASVKVEILELTGRLPLKIYKNLESVREEAMFSDWVAVGFVGPILG